MLEASIEDKAQAVEGVVEAVASVRKQNRSLEKKLSKLHVKRTKRGSSREALEDLQVRLAAVLFRSSFSLLAIYGTAPCLGSCVLTVVACSAFVLS